MKLTHFIQTNMEALLEDWEEAAVEITPGLKGEGRVVLRDHAREMLEFIIGDLLTPQSRKEAAQKALGKSRLFVSHSGGDHGADRHHQGLSVHQMVQELRALRARVTECWVLHQGGLSAKDADEMVRFNEAIDQLVATSMEDFLLLKDRETHLIETMLDASLDPIAIFDPDGRFLFLNSAMADLTGEPMQDVIGKTLGDLESDFASKVFDELATAVTTGKPQSLELYHRGSVGGELYFDTQLIPVFDNSKNVEAVVKTSRDITARKQGEQKVWHSANYDGLTGLPNGRLFLDRLDQSILEAERQGGSFALLFIDLDRFKHANDQLGHEAGDRLLVKVAERVSNKIRAEDTVARLGGDEFTVILKETDREGAREAAKTLLNSLEAEFDVDAHRVNISGSIGLTVFPDDGKLADQLMHNADQAMYAAKEYGGQRVQAYEPSMAQTESDHMKLNRELGDALRDNQLEVYYQPVIDLRLGDVCGAEALLRWNHPDKGLLTPDGFLAISEQNGLSNDIHTFVLEQALTSHLRWSKLRDGAFPININESPASFVTRGLVDQWRTRLKENSVGADWITMDLTPCSLNNLRAFGFSSIKSLDLEGLRPHMAIDGFGIEPLSLSAIQEFRMDSIKIDRNLINKAGQGGEAHRMLEGIIAMAHAINVQVVAVGVQRNEQLQFLSRIGCDFAQGFFFSPPLRQNDFEALLKRDR